MSLIYKLVQQGNDLDYKSAVMLGKSNNNKFDL